MRKILIVGGGYAGFYTAWRLEKKLRRGEAEVIVVDPRPYMTYQPFLPEVMAGSIEARHAAVSLRRHLRHTRVIAGMVSAIDHEHRVVTVRPADGDTFELDYDLIVVTAGAVTRKFPVPGIAEQAIGLKHVEEAVAIRDRLLTSFDRAATLLPGPQRQKLLTVTFVGGGFSGVEGFAELLSLATALLKRYPELHRDELRFHLIEASGRILPEVTDPPGRWVVRFLQQRGGQVHLDTQVKSATDGHVVLSTGEEFDSELIVWTAGNAANPVVGMHTDLPVDERGFLVVRPDLRVGTDAEPVPDAWAAGDDAGDRGPHLPDPGHPHGAQRPTRRPPGQAARPQHRRDLARRKAGELPAPQPRRSCDARHRSRHLPVPAARDHRAARLVDAPRLPRAGRTHLGTQGPRARDLADRRIVRPRHPLAGGGTAPARRLHHWR